MTPSESPQHKKLKDVIYTKLKEWTGATLQEYSSSGHELDVYAVTPTGHSIYVEIIWTSSRTNFFRDMTMVQTSDADVKAVVVSPKILANDEFKRQFEKVAISQRRLNFGMHGSFIDGQRILDEPDYLETELKKIVLRLLSQVKTRGKVRGVQVRFEPPEPRTVYKTEEKLFSNLFPVQRYPRIIFTSPTTIRYDREVHERFGLKIKGAPFFSKNRKLYTFDDLKHTSSPFLPIISQDQIDEEKVTDWIQDRTKRNDLMRLFNLALRNYCESRGLYFVEKHRRFVCLLEEGKTRSFRWRPKTKFITREMATYMKGEDGEILFCKHYAANLSFMLLDDDIFMQISPTMAFTYDGYHPIRSSKLASLMSRYLSKQYNSQYLNSVRFWAKFLSKLDVAISIPAGRESIEIESEPVAVPVNVGIRRKR